MIDLSYASNGCLFFELQFIYRFFINPENWMYPYAYTAHVTQVLRFYFIKMDSLVFMCEFSVHTHVLVRGGERRRRRKGRRRRERGGGEEEGEEEKKRKERRRRKRRGRRGGGGREEEGE